MISTMDNLYKFCQNQLMNTLITCKVWQTHMDHVVIVGVFKLLVSDHVVIVGVVKLLVSDHVVIVGVVKLLVSDQ